MKLVAVSRDLSVTVNALGVAPVEIIIALNALFKRPDRFPKTCQVCVAAVLWQGEDLFFIQFETNAGKGEEETTNLH